MTNQLISIAARVVAGSGRDKPADAALRQTLKEQRGLLPSSARWISQAVFHYFRWRGWLRTEEPLEQQITRSLELAGQFRQQPESFSDDDLARAVPEWTASEIEVTPAWLRGLQAEPRLWLRAKKSHGRALVGQLGESWTLNEPAFADAVAYQGTEDLFRSPEFQAGEFEVQDIASQAVGLLCAPQPGETWWDACAGEGGKTLHLSDLMENKGLIWASDRAEWRLKKLKLRTGRAKCFNYRAVLWDGGAKPPTKTKFDGVLVDAPCSGVGTWQRNPHARWTTTPADVRELGEIQKKLLAHVAPSVKPGGKLIFSVCTLTRAETTEVMTDFTQTHPEFAPLATANPFAPEAAPQPSHLLWPQATKGNGMFVALWRRNG